LYIVYLINDVLHHSTKKRIEPAVLDDLSAALQPNLGYILRTTYQNQPQETQDRLMKVLNIWAARSIYDDATVAQIERIMKGERNPTGFSASKSDDSRDEKSERRDKREKRNRSPSPADRERRSSRDDEREHSRRRSSREDEEYDRHSRRSDTRSDTRSESRSDRSTSSSSSRRKSGWD